MGAALDPASIPLALREAVDPFSAWAEDAGLNATHVAEQALVDSWLVRFANSRAKRARSVNAIGAGLLPLDEKLERAQALCDAAGLPLTIRITPFSQPTGLDTALAARGFVAFEASCVMGRALTPGVPAVSELPLHEVDAREFSETAGRLYGDDAARIVVDTARNLAFPGHGIRLLLGERAAPLAVGSVLFDGCMAGFYGIHTRSDVRGRGYAATIIETLLERSQTAGARYACLQVGAGNNAARALYCKFGFTDRYAYWYRARQIE